MKKFQILIVVCFAVFTSSAQANLKDLAAYKYVEVDVKDNFNPSTYLAFEKRDFDKLLIGEKLASMFEMSDFDIISQKAIETADKAYLLTFTYEFVADKKKCGGTIIKIMNGKIIDAKRDNTVATFKFQQKGNKICTEDIGKVLAYKLRRGS